MSFVAPTEIDSLDNGSAESHESDLDLAVRTWDFEWLGPPSPKKSIHVRQPLGNGSKSFDRISLFAEGLQQLIAQPIL